MAVNETLGPAVTAPARSLAAPDWMLALLATLVFAALHGARGFPDLLANGGDNDSLLRMVEVRDWMAGQGWFDLHQYRMGPPGGFTMHWSRLVDAPLGALVIVGTFLGGSEAAGELFAQFVWPLGLFAGSSFALLKIARVLFGEAAVLPAAVTGTAALHFAGTFAPGNIDHHGFQLLLSLCTIALLVWAAEVPAKAARFAAAAGLCAAAMLGVGAETLPYVAVAGLFAASRFALEGQAARAQARGFGLGLGCGAAVVFLGTVSPRSYWEPACDAFSAPHALLGLIGGLGLCTVAAIGPLCSSIKTRMLALAALAALCVGIAVVLFPQCLGDPYANVDPRLRAMWLNGVAEAQPFAKLLRDRPAMAAGDYATPFLATALLVRCLLSPQARFRSVLLPGLSLIAAVLVSLWQVRGSFFSLGLAVPFLAGLIGERRVIANAPKAPNGSALLLALAWLLSIPLVWAASVVMFVPMTASEAAHASAATSGDAQCEAAPTFSELARLPANTVMAVSNLGSQILAQTPHRALAGPYHRNTGGNLAALDIWMGPLAQAHPRLTGMGVGLVAFCGGNIETEALARQAPGSLISELKAGRAPSWLQIVPEASGGPLKVYRVAD